MREAARGAAMDDVMKASGEFWDGSFGSAGRGADGSNPPLGHTRSLSLSLCIASLPVYVHYL